MLEKVNMVGMPAEDMLNHICECHEELRSIRKELAGALKPTPNSAMLSCQSCKRNITSIISPTCHACVRFPYKRTDWYEQQ
jgi:hypothetical protein